jgi:hypothetical protein
MNKRQLSTAIEELLEKMIEVYEVTDLKLEEEDRGILYELNHTMSQLTDLLRQARRYSRVLLEQYEDDLTRKPEYLDDSIDKDEDEDDDD